MDASIDRKVGGAGGVYLIAIGADQISALLTSNLGSPGRQVLATMIDIEPILALASQYGNVLIALSIFLLLIVLEALFPRKRRVQGRLQRWSTNIGFIVVDTLALKLLGPLVAVAAADYALGRELGLLNWLLLPSWLEFLIALLLLDLAIYVQHILTHKVGILWAIHKVHHADRDIDVTTALRFHPFEIILSMLYKVVIVLVIGASPAAVIVFAVGLNLCAMFNHSNWRLSLPFDRLLRWIMVTPDMHRVHHSFLRRETDSNYGATISLWDRLFGTYIAAPTGGHDAMVIGLAEYQSARPAQLWWSLALPLLGRSAADGAAEQAAEQRGGNPPRSNQQPPD